MMYNFLKLFISPILKLIFNIDIIGGEKIPEKDRVIICANHMSILDPFIIALTTKRPIYFMAKKELFENKFLNWILCKLNAFPVDRDSSDIKAIKTSLRILKEEKVLGIFPEGTRVKEFDLDNAKAGVAMLAIKSQSQIVPIKISSEYRIFKDINILVGDPLDYSHLYGEKLKSEDYQKISEDILKNIYDIC